MRFVIPFLLLHCALSLETDEKSSLDRKLRHHSDSEPNKRSKSRKGKGGKDHEDYHEKKLTLTILNETFQQPFSPFFVMVHNCDADPLYVRGEPSSDALAILAEDGDPSMLVEEYEGSDGVFSVKAIGSEPIFGGQKMEIEVTVNDEYPLVTIASMAINTNDAFVAINGMELMPGMVLDTPGLDAGTEENNEDCSSVPGPACDLSSGNERSGNGEGFVHVHRGIMEISDLSLRYDWRNPMMRVSVN